MIVKGRPPLEAARTAVTRAEVREQLVELLAQIFEAELRQELQEAAGARPGDTSEPIAGAVRSEP